MKTLTCIFLLLGITISGFSQSRKISQLDTASAASDNDIIIFNDAQPKTYSITKGNFLKELKEELDSIVADLNVTDTIINFGFENTRSTDPFNGVVGHYNNVTTPEGISVGYYNNLTHIGYQFGAFISSGANQTITIGRGWNESDPLVNDKYGSIGLGYFADKPILYIQSGLEPGEAWTEDVGGVSIGSSDLDTLTALQITSHRADGTSFLIKGSNSNLENVFSLDDQGNLNISGVLTADSLVCQTVPSIYSAPGDTTNLKPDKIGDIFINTTTGDSYMSTGAERGDWVKLNFFLPFLLAFRKRTLFMLLLFPLTLYGQNTKKISRLDTASAMADQDILLFNTTGPNSYVITKKNFLKESKNEINQLKSELINFGLENYFHQAPLNGVIGHRNQSNAKAGMIIGNNNDAGCGTIFIMGTQIHCAADENFSIGGGWFATGENFSNNLPGSIGLGYRSKSPVLYVHSGYENNDPVVGNIGGVSIGYKAFDTLTALNVSARRGFGSYNTLLNGYNNNYTKTAIITSGGDVTISGTITADKVTSQKVPNVYHSIADTTAFPVPWKMGDFFINTEEKKIYVSRGTTRGDWVLIGQ